MKKIYLVLILCLIGFVSVLGQRKAEIKHQDAKNMIKKSLVSKNIFSMDANLSSCKGYDQQVKNGNADYNACLNPDTAPGGSALDKFNKLSNADLAKYCGSMTLQDCVNKVKNEQAVFCKEKSQLTQKKLDQLKKQCSQAKKECSTTSYLTASLQGKVWQLNQDKKKLEADLAKLNKELEAFTIEYDKARAISEKQCKMK